MARAATTARSTNNANRPQNLEPTALQRATRRTRSQSRDVSEAPAEPKIVPNSKRGTRSQSRQTSVESETSVGSRPKRNTRRNAAQQPIRQLGTVQESPDLEAEPINEILDDAEEHLETANTAMRSTSVISHRTSTTNMTSASQAELEQMDPDDIIEFLPDLYSNAVQLLRFLLPPNSSPEKLRDTVRQLADDHSKQRKRFDVRDRAFTNVQESFGQRTYLRLDLILRSLLHLESINDIPDRLWRPDDLVYSANLAMAMKQIVLLSPGDAQIYDIVFSLDAAFPTPFLSGFDFPGVGASEFLRETYELALELRTQVAVMALISPEAQEIEDPTQIIRAAFYDEDESEESVDDPQFTVKGWTGLPPPYEFHTYEGIFTDTINKRATDLVEIILQAESPKSALRTLQQQFPWEGLKFRFMTWAEQRMNELTDSIAARGGQEQIVNALEYRRANGELEGEVVASREAPVIQPIPEPSSSKAVEAPTSTASKSLGTKRGIAALKARQQKLASTAPVAGAPKATPVPSSAPLPAPQRTSPAYPQSAQPADHWQPVDEGADDDEIEEVSKPQPSLSPRRTQLEQFRQQYLAKQRENKENQPQRSLLDPQPGATRVNWDGSQEIPVRQAEGFRLPRHQQPDPRPSQQKRARVEEGDDVADGTQDAGFETDTRIMPVPVRRVDDAAAPPRRPQQQPMSPPTSRPVRTPSPPKRQRKNPGQAIDPYEPPPRNGSEQPASGYDYTLVSHAAKVKTQQAAHRREARQRNAWTLDEVNQLQSLIAEFGCSWAKLKQRDEDSDDKLLWRRKAEDLRFKARNMKVEYLKAGVDLPPNFDYVQLGRKELDQLIRVGVYHEQNQIRARAGGGESDEEVMEEEEE